MRGFVRGKVEVGGGWGMGDRRLELSVAIRATDDAEMQRKLDQRAARQAESPRLSAGCQLKVGPWAPWCLAWASA